MISDTAVYVDTSGVHTTRIATHEATPYLNHAVTDKVYLCMDSFVRVKL